VSESRLGIAKHDASFAKRPSSNRLLRGKTYTKSALFISYNARLYSAKCHVCFAKRPHTNRALFEKRSTKSAPTRRGCAKCDVSFAKRCHTNRAGFEKRSTQEIYAKRAQPPWVSTKEAMRLRSAWFGINVTG